MKETKPYWYHNTAYSLEPYFVSLDFPNLFICYIYPAKVRTGWGACLIDVYGGFSVCGHYLLFLDLQILFDAYALTCHHLHLCIGYFLYHCIKSKRNKNGGVFIST